MNIITALALGALIAVTPATGPALDQVTAGQSSPAPIAAPAKPAKSAPVKRVKRQPAKPALAPCQYEDGPGPCIWNAKTRGNGKGQSFIIHADGTITYI